jgi:hypothetical protein
MKFPTSPMTSLMPCKSSVPLPAPPVTSVAPSPDRYPPSTRLRHANRMAATISADPMPI